MLGGGGQKNRFIETVLLSTHRICFGREIRKINFIYALYVCGAQKKRLIETFLSSIHSICLSKEIRSTI